MAPKTHELIEQEVELVKKASSGKRMSPSVARDAAVRAVKISRWLNEEKEDGTEDA